MRRIAQLLLIHQRSERHRCDEQVTGFLAPQCWRKEQQSPYFQSPVLGKETE